MTPPENPMPEFPPESEWLACEPPSVGPEFVGATLARLRDAALLQPDPRAAGDERTLARLDLPREVLDAGAPPAASPRFVDGVLAAWKRDREVAVDRALPAYRVPPPSPDFVARTLRALRRERSPRLRLVATAVVAAIAAAAALLLWLRTGEAAQLPESRLVQAVAAGAPAASPSLLSTLLLASERDADDLPIVPLDAFQLVAAEGSPR